MNYKYIFNIIGKVLRLEAILMILPIIVGLIYHEPFMTSIFSFLVTAIGLVIIGTLMNISKAKDLKISPRAAFVIVTLSWLFMSLFGCIPLIISKQIPNFFDAFFEMCSGFTTTGASILTDIESLNHSTLFWRSFSHWIGGMGVIVFILAILPDSKEGTSMHILRAESPGPQVGKIVSKMGATARILYLIYIVLTILEFILLLVGKDPKMDAFASLTLTLGTAGTGGFSIFNDSIASCTPYTQYVIAIFMVLFGTNFTIFYLLLTKKFSTVFKNEELKIYYAIVLLSTAFITFNVYTSCKNMYSTFEEVFRHSFFQVASIISTTGYSTTPYYTPTGPSWPTASICVLMLLTFTGACAGSTGGGMKLSRIELLFKAIIRKIKQMVQPRKVIVIKESGNIVDESLVSDAEIFSLLYILLIFMVTFIISFDGFDILTNFTAALTCVSNVGPGLGIIGPTGNFSQFSSFSKFVLSLLMITGRLELFPLVALFYPRTWTKR